MQQPRGETCGSLLNAGLVATADLLGDNISRGLPSGHPRERSTRGKIEHSDPKNWDNQPVQPSARNTVARTPNPNPRIG